MSDKTKQVVRRWFEEVWNQRRPDVIDELLTASSVCHTDAGPIVGPQEFREKMYAPFLAAFPDIQVTIEDVLADGDRAVVRWRASGTHSGHGMGMTPSGKTPEFQGMTWIELHEGRFKDGWQYSTIPQVLPTLG